VLGNWIGTDPAGCGFAWKWRRWGSKWRTRQTIKSVGPPPVEGNRIAFNHGNGLLVRGDGAVGITISGNAIFANNGHAINLQPTGEKPNMITPNDVSDEDAGPNHLQNAPVITNTAYFFGQTIISGFLRSKEDSQYSIELFRNDSYGDMPLAKGKPTLAQPLSQLDCKRFWAIPNPGAWRFRRQLFAATAQDLDTGDTSEFSASVPISKGVLRISSSAFGSSNFISFTPKQHPIPPGAKRSLTATRGVVFRVLRVFRERAVRSRSR